jgi:hypothetical protein
MKYINLNFWSDVFNITVIFGVVLVLALFLPSVFFLLIFHNTL